MREKLRRMTEAELLAWAYLGFLSYWLFLLLSWPPLRGFLSRLLSGVI